ncbi:MAG: hypothetical protein ABIM30_00085 [candidate division WOR-3 bacterium]
MKILYDAYISGSKYRIDISVEDKGALSTDKIFIHKSSDDSFVKVCTLAELDLVPEKRYSAEYYRRENATIVADTVYEADSIREQVSQQINSLALELKTAEEFYKKETAVEYPLVNEQGVPATQRGEVDKLYDEYLKIKEERDLLLKQRSELKAKMDTLQQEVNYIESVFSPILSQLSNNSYDAEGYSYVLSVASSLRSVISKIVAGIQELKNIRDVYSNLNNVQKYNEDIDVILWWSGHDPDYICLNKNTQQAILKIVYDLSEARDNLSNINSSISSFCDNLEKAYSVRVDSTNNEIKTYPLLSDDTLISLHSNINMIINKLKESQTLINTLSTIISSISTKYRQSIVDIDKQISLVNSKIDSYNNALDELKGNILDKNPNFDLQLF